MLGLFVKVMVSVAQWCPCFPASKLVCFSQELKKEKTNPFLEFYKDLSGTDRLNKP